jgi:hypothetical protein
MAMTHEFERLNLKLEKMQNMFNYLDNKISKHSDG